MDNFNLTAIAGILGGLALALAVIALWQIRSLNTLRKNFFAGKKGANLEHIIEGLKAELKNLYDEQAALGLALNRLKEAQGYSIQKIGVVRFNPFEDLGGNFSFCIALLDVHGNGVVITSMHGRQQNRVYTKKITSGQSEMQLTEEEQKAIEQATEKTKT